LGFCDAEEGGWSEKGKVRNTLEEKARAPRWVSASASPAARGERARKGMRALRTGAHAAAQRTARGVGVARWAAPRNINGTPLRRRSVCETGWTHRGHLGAGIGGASCSKLCLVKRASAGSRVTCRGGKKEKFAKGQSARHFLHSLRRWTPRPARSRAHTDDAIHLACVLSGEPMSAPAAGESSASEPSHDSRRHPFFARNATQNCRSLSPRPPTGPAPLARACA
jgi:hypothetical protein